MGFTANSRNTSGDDQILTPTYIDCSNEFLKEMLKYFLEVGGWIEK